MPLRMSVQVSQFENAVVIEPVAMEVGGNQHVAVRGRWQLHHVACAAGRQAIGFRCEPKQLDDFGGGASRSRHSHPIGKTRTIAATLIAVVIWNCGAVRFQAGCDLHFLL